jgi:hypothetical protein
LPERLPTLGPAISKNNITLLAAHLNFIFSQKMVMQIAYRIGCCDTGVFEFTGCWVQLDQA